MNIVAGIKFKYEKSCIWPKSIMEAQEVYDIQIIQNRISKKRNL